MPNPMDARPKLPQECPECKVSLADQNVPPEYGEHQGQFSLVLMDENEYQCPVCRHVWPRPDPLGLRRRTRRKRQPGNPAKRSR